MIIDLSPRRSGKTIRMITSLLNNKSRVLLTFCEIEQDRLRKQYPLVKDQIFSWRQWHLQHRCMGMRTSDVVIDNADLILQEIAHYPLKAVSMSDENTETETEKAIRALTAMVGFSPQTNEDHKAIGALHIERLRQEQEQKRAVYLYEKINSLERERSVLKEIIWNCSECFPGEDSEGRCALCHSEEGNECAYCKKHAD